MYGQLSPVDFFKRHDFTKRIDLERRKIAFWRGKPDFKEKCLLPVNVGILSQFESHRYIFIPRIALENKAAAERPPPKKGMKVHKQKTCSS